jgi:predicted nucleic acid-binding protein
MYLDSAYVAKYYLNEPDSPRVRELIQGGDSLISSAWCVAEVSCVFHRCLRNGDLSEAQVQYLSREFLSHVDAGLWTLVPVTTALIRRLTSIIATLPPGVFLRAGDAVHLVSALDAGEHEVWSNDRRLLAAAHHFGLAGRSA